MYIFVTFLNYLESFKIKYFLKNIQITLSKDEYTSDVLLDHLFGDNLTKNKKCTLYRTCTWFTPHIRYVPITFFRIFGDVGLGPRKYFNPPNFMYIRSQDITK